MDAENQSLVHEEGMYEISFSECRNSATVLDWIFQIHGKSWADEATLVGLLNAFDEVLHPQETICGQGVDKQVDGRELARDYIADPEARDRLVEAFRATFEKP